MAIFETPSLKTLIARVQTDYQAAVGATATIRRSFPYGMSRAQAGLADGLYGLISKAVNELHPWTATSYGVTFWARVLDVVRIDAVPATVVVRFVGTVGNEIPAGAILVRDDGAEYTVDALVTIGGGGHTDAAVTASVAGLASACANGSTLTISTPIAGITSACVVQSTTTDGLDQETLPALKARYLGELANPPQGGAVADYEAWTLAVAGVVKVWVTPLWAGEGTVLVRFLVDGVGSAAIPDSGELDAVRAALAIVRPVTAHVTVAAPTAKPWEFIIDLTAAAGHVLADVKAAVYAELRALFQDVAAPGVTVPRSVYDAAISRALGEASHEVLSMDGGGGIEDPADLTHADGEIPVLEDGGITWA